MPKVRVPLHQNPRNFATVDTEATNGAQVGRNLYGPDGQLLTAAQVINPAGGSSGGSSSVGATVWKLIREVPTNIKNLAALIGKGFVTRSDDGEFHTRTIQQGTGVQVTNGDGATGNPAVGLSTEALESLALADSAVQQIIEGEGVEVDSSDPQRPIISTDSTAFLYPQLFSQAGEALTDQQGRPLRQNTPSIPYEYLTGPGTGFLQRDASGVWSLSTLNALPPMTLVVANALTGVADFQMVAITDLAGGREPCWYDSTVASGTKWRRFSDRSIAN